MEWTSATFSPNFVAPESTIEADVIDSFQDIPTFVRVVETGGFAPAARQLNLSRSAVGKTVARLENRLGTRLFHRSTRRQSLTDDGQTFYEHCQRALGELRAGKASLESARKTIEGKLRVSMPVLFGRLCVAPILMRLAAQQPKLALDLSFNDRLVELIEDGFDLAIRNGPLLVGSGLKARRIARERVLLYGSSAYLERRGEPAGLNELRAHDFVVYARAGRLYPWQPPEGCNSLREPTENARFRFDDLDMVADAAAAGFGLAWLPEWLARTRVASGHLVRVTAAEAFTTDIYAVWPETPYLPARTRAAIDVLAAEMSDAVACAA